MTNRRIVCCLVFFCYTFGRALTESTEECKHANKSSAYRLKKFLDCNYVWNDRSAKSNETKVSISIFPTFAVMDDYYSSLDLYTYMHTVWMDSRLIWEPEVFDGLETVSMSSSDIWTPDLAVQSSGHEDKYERSITEGQCEVRYDGEVRCTPKHHHTIKCRPDFTLWPYDRHNCTLIISSWLRSEVPISINSNKNWKQLVLMHVFASNGGWDFTVSRIAYEKKTPEYPMNVTVPKLSIDFIVDRNHAQLSTRSILPGIIMMSLTLTTVWLDPLSKERLAVASLNPIIHLLCIHDIKWIIPHNVYFYMDSFVLTFVAFLLTVFLRKIQETRMHPPRWISSCVSSMLQYRVGQILLLNVLDPQASGDTDSEERNDLVGSSTRNPIWTQIVNFLSWLSLIVFSFVYILMWALLVPSPSMRKTIDDVSWRHFP